MRGERIADGGCRVGETVGGGYRARGPWKTLMSFPLPERSGPARPHSAVIHPTRDRCGWDAGACGGRQPPLLLCMYVRTVCMYVCTRARYTRLSAGLGAVEYRAAARPPRAPPFAKVSRRETAVRNSGKPSDNENQNRFPRARFRLFTAVAAVFHQRLFP